MMSMRDEELVILHRSQQIITYDGRAKPARWGVKHALDSDEVRAINKNGFGAA